MAEFIFGEAVEVACRHYAVLGRAKLQAFFQRGLFPEATEDTATVTFIRFEGRTYAVTAQHVITTFAKQAENDAAGPESYFIASGKGAVLNPPIVSPPAMWPERAPDVALGKIDDDFPARVGKEAFVLWPEVVPTFPVPSAAAFGFPTKAKTTSEEAGRERLAVSCIRAVAEGLPAPAHADQLQFFSEIDANNKIGSLSGMSGGPVFWSDGNQLGLLGFVKEALDIETPAGEETIHSGPRVNFICQHASYDTFGRWAEYAEREAPKEREALGKVINQDDQS